MNRLCLLGLYLMTLPSLVMADVTVQVWWQGQPYRNIDLTGSPRLTDLLTNPQLPEQSYWPVAQIATQARYEQMLHSKQVLLSDLKTLQMVWMQQQRGDLVQSSQQLLRELDQVNVSGRLDIEVDPDVSRSKTIFNPKLEGAYLLFLAPRRPLLHMVGLINVRESQSITAGAGLGHYWQGHHLLAGGDPAELFLIIPNGKIRQVPVAIWNEQHIEPMPEAILFAGFNPSVLPSNYRDINQRIAQLLVNRIPE